MKKQLLSGTDLTISPVALGTDSYGLTLDENASYAMLDEFLDRGGNLLDTALIYSDWEPGEKSRSEKLLGRWMKSRGNRDKVVISTKGAHPEFAHMDVPRLSRREIEGDIEQSLLHLGCDYIDIYWLHRDGANVPVGDVMETLNDLVKTGKTRYFGMSNWTHERIEEANRYADEHGLCRIVSSQIQHSIADGIPENNDKTLVLMNDGEYDYFSRTKMPVFAFASQAKGFFSKLDKGGAEALSPKARTRYLSEENLRRFDVIRRLAAEHGTTVGGIVVAALTSNTDFQTIPIIGCKNSDQLSDSMNGADILLTQAEIDEITKRKR